MVDVNREQRRRMKFHNEMVPPSSIDYGKNHARTRLHRVGQSQKGFVKIVKGDPTMTDAPVIAEGARAAGDGTSDAEAG